MTLGRPLEYNPEIALDAAMQLFWRDGYESTSLQNLLDTMEISKSTFYQAFKSKRALFEMALVHYRTILLNSMRSQFIQTESAKDFIENALLGVGNETVGADAQRGCLLMNTANEFAQNDAAIALVVSEGINQIKSTFEKAIRKAQKQGDISSDKNAKHVAAYLVSSMSGLKNMAKAGANRKTINQIVSVTIQVLD